MHTRALVGVDVFVNTRLLDLYHELTLMNILKLLNGSSSNFLSW